MWTEPASTWYETAPGHDFAAPPLPGPIEADVCIVGGGLAGLSAAIELQSLGRSIALIERHRIGGGASGRNGGFVSAGFAEGLSAIAARTGSAHGDALYRLSMEGVEIVRDRVARIVPEALMGEGQLLVLRRPGSGALERSRDLMQRSFERALEHWDCARTRSVLQSERYFEALHDGRAFHIQPLHYARGIARTITEADGRIYEHSPALSIRREGSRQIVATPEGRISAGSVVLATSALDRKLWPRLSRAVLPITTYIAVTEPLGDRASQAIATGAAIADDRRAGDYYRLLAGGRILWGGRITTRRSQPRQLGEMLKADMLSVFPQLGAPRIEHAWAGSMGYARHKMPIVGRIADGVWTATAFGGHGLNTTAIAGRLVAHAIAGGEDDRIRLFEPFGADWAGGPIGRAGVQLTYWSMQLRDRIDERRAERSSVPRNPPNGSDDRAAD